MSNRIDIAAAMTDLLRVLETEGINDMKFPDAKAESKEDWTPDYAIIQDVYYDDFMMDDGMRNYFDSSQLIYDLKQMTRARFADDPTVTVGFYGEDCMGISEIEVYRKKEPAE